MKAKLIILATTFVFSINPVAGQENISRQLWASICTKTDVTTSSNTNYNKDFGKLLLSWRMLPNDNQNTSFLLFRRGADVNGKLTCITYEPVFNTCYQTSSVPSEQSTYYLLPGDYFGDDIPFSVSNDSKKKLLREQALDSLTIGTNIYQDKLPYIEIPLRSTDDCSDYPKEFKYQANDCSVGDLDGDGQMEVIVKRLLTYYDATTDTIKGTSEGAGNSDSRARHIALFEAYKLDGTFLWRVKSGPNIIAGNSINFAVADLDGDGCAEVVTKTGEGTVFGDGYEIPDTDGDGKVDYRDIWPTGHYTGDGPKGYGGPEFFSVIDGKTGRELARANFIGRGPDGATPAELAKDWEANDWKWDPRAKKYTWKLANSLRLGVAEFTGKGKQIFLGRGVYGRTIVEAWDYTPAPSNSIQPGTLTRLWRIDTDDEGGEDKNKDGKPYSAYAGQGNHAFNVADLDGDGYDEVMYGSCAWDHDGSGLWTTGLGHGDANHVGKFLPDREGLQVYHCLESGVTDVALHDAKTGETIWSIVSPKASDAGRCMVADVDPSSPGCEFWQYGNELYSQDCQPLYNNNGKRKEESSANAGIWFDGYLNRQLINEGIINSFSHGRTFTMYRFDISFNNSTKSNPGWYGDMLGDWREEVIVPDSKKTNNLKIFSTWYPTEHRFPWLMTDHTYYMQCIHQQVGYNQPTNLGYYLGSDLTSDAEAWAAAKKAEEDRQTALHPTAIQNVSAPAVLMRHAGIYNLNGQRVTKPTKGLYILHGKKMVVHP